jgi:hypothetical protein
MDYKYKHAGIAGKFRLLHKAHVELILRAIDYTETLHVFIVDTPQYKRYATVDELKASFTAIFDELGYTRYELHIIKETLTGAAWDRKLLQVVPELQAMFDSKEVYGNVLLRNEFIKLSMSKDVSVTKIERALYRSDNFSLIAEPFKRYLTKTIILNWATEDVQIAADNNLLARRISMYYDAAFYELEKMSLKQQAINPRRLTFITNNYKQDEQIDKDVDRVNSVDGIIYLQREGSSMSVTIAEAKRGEETVLLTRRGIDFKRTLEMINALLQGETDKLEE